MIALALGWAVLLDGVVLVETVAVRRDWSIRLFCDEHHDGDRKAYDRARRAGRVEVRRVEVKEWGGW